MSRRELYARRKQQQRIRSIISIGALILTILVVFSVSGLVTNARSTSDEQEYKYFMSYELEKGDSLWAIAEDHFDTNNYESVDQYMEEICIINSITIDTTLYEGMNLIVPYYSTEFK